MKQSKTFSNNQKGHRFMVEDITCGKPVIMIFICTVPFLVEKGVNCIVIPINKNQLAESIIYSTENPELRKLCLGEANIRRMAEYNRDKIAKQYHALYSEMFDA